MGYNILYNFSGSTNGSLPVNGVVLSGNTLYGTTFDGGRLREGAVFSLSLGSGSITPPSLTLTPAGGNVILTWPTNATGFTLEFTTNLVSPAVWSTVSGKFAVTNPVSGTQKFYRLSQ
jgi:flavin reductase (DIM6/NTAB) family NADH-FMN oxidoreductase RutF